MSRMCMRSFVTFRCVLTKPYRHFSKTGNNNKNNCRSALGTLPGPKSESVSQGLGWFSLIAERSFVANLLSSYLRCFLARKFVTCVFNTGKKIPIFWMFKIRQKFDIRAIRINCLLTRTPMTIIYYTLISKSDPATLQYLMSFTAIIILLIYWKETWYVLGLHSILKALANGYTKCTVQTVNIVFLSMTKMPRTLNPIGYPCSRSRNRFNCKIQFRRLKNETIRTCH